VAGTDVVIDAVVLRRRPPGEARRGAEWEPTETAATVDGPAVVNQVFVEHPEWILGDLRVRHGQYNAADVTVTAQDEPVGALLTATLGDIAAAARASGLAATPRPAHRAAPHPTAAAASMEAHYKEGSLLATATGRFARVEAGRRAPFQPSPRSGAGELRAVIAPRDAFHRVIDAQRDGADDGAWEAARRDLNDAYDRYRDRYGPLNRSPWPQPAGPTTKGSPPSGG
jgi:hypothetical protein